MVEAALQQDAGHVLFLGTGCAEPSKYRGSSGIHLRCHNGRCLDFPRPPALPFLMYRRARNCPTVCVSTAGLMLRDLKACGISCDSALPVLLRCFRAAQGPID